MPGHDIADMSDDALRKAIAALETLRRQTQPLSPAINALRSTIESRQRLIADAHHFRTAMRVAVGPLEDLRRSLTLASEHATAELRSVFRLYAALDRQFRLPNPSDTQKLIQAWTTIKTESALSSYGDHVGDIRQVIDAITTPWLDTKNALASLNGLLGLQSIGKELHSRHIFDVASAERLRHHLGDWRPTIDWPAAVFTDPLERSHFYIERGLDPDLTYFPASAFNQAITNAGIKRDPPSYDRPYDRADDQGTGDDTGFERNNAAHDHLQRFESHLRAFIDRRMTATVGRNWIKSHVPGTMRQEWEAKRVRALDSGEPKRPLIAYADFTDYVQIIVRRDNWREVFESDFRRKALVQESLQRLYPIRICTMHARIISQDDELYLHAETRRLLIAMGIEG